MSDEIQQVESDRLRMSAKCTAKGEWYMDVTYEAPLMSQIPPEIEDEAGYREATEQMLRSRANMMSRAVKMLAEEFREAGRTVVSEPQEIVNG